MSNPDITEHMLMTAEAESFLHSRYTFGFVVIRGSEPVPGLSAKLQ